MNDEANKNEVIILSGISGSGKSRFARQLHVHNDAYIVSSDFYFDELARRQGCSYTQVFSPRLLGEAHAQCLTKFIDRIYAHDNSSGNTIVVDNTNTTTLEMAPYVSIAMARGYKVRLITFNCEVETALKRNVHGVRQDVLLNQAERLRTRELPSYWDIDRMTENQDDDIDAFVELSERRGLEWILLRTSEALQHAACGDNLASHINIMTKLAQYLSTARMQLKMGGAK